MRGKNGFSGPVIMGSVLPRVEKGRRLKSDDMFLILCILGRRVNCSSFSPVQQGGSGVLLCGSPVVAAGKVPKRIWEQEGAAGALDWGDLWCAPLCANLGAGGASPFPTGSLQRLRQRLLPRRGSPGGCSWQSGLRAELAFAGQKYPLLPQERSVPVHLSLGLQGWGTLGGPLGH